MIHESNLTVWGDFLQNGKSGDRNYVCCCLISEDLILLVLVWQLMFLETKDTSEFEICAECGFTIRSYSDQPTFHISRWRRWCCCYWLPHDERVSPLDIFNIWRHFRWLTIFICDLVVKTGIWIQTMNDSVRTLLHRVLKACNSPLGRSRSRAAFDTTLRSTFTFMLAVNVSEKHNTRYPDNTVRLPSS